MGYIKKKEGNLIIPKALSNGHWQVREEKEFKNAVGQDNIAFLPHYDKKDRHSHSQTDVWIGHGAVAGVIAVFCGLLIVHNMKEGDRVLASDPNDPSIVEVADEKQKDIDNNIVENLNSGKRELSSINEVSLEEKEYFEHTLLNSYYVSFDAEDLLSEVQLRPEKSPIYIKDHMEFIHKNSSFFPQYSQIQNISDTFDLDENLKISVYRMTGSSDVSSVNFRTDEQGMLISIIVENQE